MQNQPTFLLIHGAFANSFSFAPFQAELALHGHRSAAVDLLGLPGHGFEATYPAAYQAPPDLAALAAEPGGIKGVTLADNVARVIEVLERAKRTGPTLLVSHSRGGVTATAVANARPDLIDWLVYVAAWCPVELDVNDYYTRSRRWRTSTPWPSPARWSATRPNSACCAPTSAPPTRRRSPRSSGRLPPT